jgi:broad specificity phosphatase PhoE
MPPALILVRHAMPEVREDVPPERWQLSPMGRTAAARLRAVLPPSVYLVASEETKAWQTLTVAAGRAVARDHRLGEVRRNEPHDSGFAERRRRYVGGIDHPGWERRAEVAERFGAAIGEHLARADGRPVVVGSHGMALTVWLSQAVGLADPAGFWARLKLPDVLPVDLTAGTVGWDSYR